jgi:hypothetical protein
MPDRIASEALELSAPLIRTAVHRCTLLSLALVKAAAKGNTLKSSLLPGQACSCQTAMATYL